MRLKTLAGAYAGQVRDYSTVTGLAALRSGTAVRLEGEIAPPPASVTADQSMPGLAGKRRRVATVAIHQ